MAEVLSIASATVASVVERNQSNSRYAFEININWSNGGKSTCIKSYNEFFEVHCKLLDAFPDAAGKTKNNPRIIPFLPGKKMFRRSTKQLAQERLPQLDMYMKALVALPGHISTCAILMEFLECETIVNSVPVQTTNTVDSPPNELGGSEAIKISSNHTVSYSVPMELCGSHGDNPNTPSSTEEPQQPLNSGDSILPTDSQQPTDSHKGIGGDQNTLTEQPNKSQDQPNERDEANATKGDHSDDDTAKEDNDSSTPVPQLQPDTNSSIERVSGNDSDGADDKMDDGSQSDCTDENSTKGDHDDGNSSSSSSSIQHGDGDNGSQDDDDDIDRGSDGEKSRGDSIDTDDNNSLQQGGTDDDKVDNDQEDGDKHTNGDTTTATSD